MIVSGDDQCLYPGLQRRAYAVRRHLASGSPHQRVEDQSTKLRDPPVVIEMTAGEPEASPTVVALDRPAHGVGSRLASRVFDHDRNETRIGLAKPDLEIEFLLKLEWSHASVDRMRRRCGGSGPLARLDSRVPVIRRVAGLVVEIAADPLGNLVVDADGMEGRPMKEDDATASLHLLFQLSQVVAQVKWMVLFSMVRSA